MVEVVGIVAMPVLIATFVKVVYYGFSRRKFFELLPLKVLLLNAMLYWILIYKYLILNNSFVTTNPCSLWYWY